MQSLVEPADSAQLKNLTDSDIIKDFLGALQLIDARQLDNASLVAALANFTPNETQSMRESWRRAQEDMITKTAEVRKWANWRLPAMRHGSAEYLEGPSPKNTTLRDFSQGARKYDLRFFEDFMKKFLNEPNFYAGLTYIPIPWWQIMFGIGDKRGARFACQVMRNLEPNKTYFTVMTQASVGEFMQYGKCQGLSWQNILVFDSRGWDYNYMDIPRIPIPILRYKDWPQRKEEQVEKRHRVIFHGTCNSEIRRAMGPGHLFPGTIAAGGRYDWDIDICGHKIPVREFQDVMYNSTWAIAPAGSTPVCYMLYEALQAGTLGIIPYATYDASSKNHYQLAEKPRKPFREEVRLWLPYRDIGVQWQHELVEIIPWRNISTLKDQIESIPDSSIRERRAKLKKLLPLFRGYGLFAYILYMCRKASIIPDLSTPNNHFTWIGRSTQLMSKMLHHRADFFESAASLDLA
eukprot:gnl/TRDRNA2_/TRDRNA2_169506_c0_seq2.p1 gnl/TRDRNA2_/TRDRNA2_169506_c0~~gnl/TRDRNA2_/TRDRNA2_169506_c0_seq2.p1  ORF type:complete len:463 (-),score=44.40 gnl/TRDRNA2_/TRDRNA2_169506_c0_seq2:84-1472(-)